MAVVLTFLLAVVSGAPGLPAAAAATDTFTNPIKSIKGADPWLQYHDGHYYLVTTSFSSELTMRKSPTLAGLATAPSVQVWADTTPDRCCNMWAPELHFFDDHWYLYYVAGQNVSNYVPTQRIHVLESVGTDPLGPYVYKNRLFDPAYDKMLIDPNILRVNGALYLLGSAITSGNTPNLVILPMRDPYTVNGPMSTIAVPTHAWEQQKAPVLEAPEALYHDGKTFIVYSSSACDTPEYKLGLLSFTGGDPLAASSWTKSPTPVFQRDDAAGVYGPGHNGFFTSPDGTENWIVYHANDSADGRCGNLRTTRAQKFSWNADGTPNFGDPVALGAPLTVPSGETATTPTSYTLVNRNSGKCLDVTGGRTADGTNVIQWTCHGGDNQKWRVEDLGDDTSRLVSVATGKVLDVNGCGTADGTHIQQWTWLNNTCQRFRLVYTETGWVRLVNANSGKVADVADCGTGDGTDVRQWTWLNNNCQQWRLDPS
jgi:GH43 family beta-xylosidase